MWWCLAALAADPVPAPPIANWLDDEAEARNAAARKRWFADRHKAPPGVDWKVIERQNGLEQIDKRNGIAGLRDGGPAWVERGSDNQAGRTHVTRRSPDGGTLYVGTSLGGLWRGNPDGTGWEPLGDNLYGGVHQLEVVAGDVGDVLVVATDWGSVHRSTDDGVTWQSVNGIPDGYSLRRLTRATDGSDTLFLVMRTWYEGTVLMRSTDGGANFATIRSLGDYAGDVWVPRDGGEGVWLLAGDGLYRSDDLGDRWAKLGANSFGPEAGELAISEAGRIWAVGWSGGVATLYRSDDDGASFAAVTRMDDYWSALETSSVDPDVFAWGGVEVHRTDDGGESFGLVNAWWAYYDDPSRLLHADLMGIDVLVDDDGGETWYYNTDGGTYQSKNLGRTVENLSLRGLRISQYYDVLTSEADPSHIAAGAQDQGYQWSGRQPQTGEVWDFTQEISGDYAHLISADGTHALVHSVYPGFILTQEGEDAPVLFGSDFPAEEASRYYAWLPPLEPDPTDPTAFFFSATRLYRYARVGDTWTPTRWSEQRFDLTDYEFLSAFHFSPHDPALAFAATSTGSLYRSTDAGVTWTPAGAGPDSHYFHGTTLVPSADDPNLVYVGGSGYGDERSVWRSQDGGATYAPWDEGLPDTLVYVLVEARDGTGRMFAGTETSAYVRAPKDAAWTDITAAEAPVTLYWSAEALGHENTIRFATYGRGIWDYRLDPDGTGCFRPNPVDHDGDGVFCDADCDDFDAAKAPGKADVCDGVDVNCDPADVVEVDGDRDGVIACLDCDDSRADVFAGAEEVRRDGVDQDCDGEDLKGCGCDGVGGGAGPWLLLALVGLRRSRRVTDRGQSPDRP